MCAAVRYSSRSERQLHHSTRRLPAESLRSVVAKFAATYLPRSPTPGDYKTLLRFWYQSGRHVDYFRIESGRLSYFQVPNRVKQRATYRAHYSAGQSLPASPQASLQRLMALMAHIFPGPSLVMDPPDMVYLLFQPMYLHARRYRSHPWMRVWMNVSNSVDPHSSPWTAID
jgi:hypothetical protein